MKGDCRMSEEYIEQLYFCAEHKLLCFEFYRRNKDWKRGKCREDETGNVLRRDKECKNELI